MPELPEVECVKKSLKKHLEGQVIKKIDVKNPNLFWKVDDEKVKKMTNSRVIEITRRAKYILIRGDLGFLVFHLGMTGKLLKKEKGEKLEKHDHIIIELEEFDIVYNDVRRFGFFEWQRDKKSLAERFSHLGLEPCDPGFNGAYLLLKAKSRTITIKELLMDSKVVVGIGNIYANEILFRTRIHPERACKSLSAEELERICRESRLTLSESISAGGSSLRDYVDADGVKGRFQEKHLIYSRAEKPCFVCGNIIKKITQAARASFVCEFCQKK